MKLCFRNTPSHISYSRLCILHYIDAGVTLLDHLSIQVLLKCSTHQHACSRTKEDGKVRGHEFRFKFHDVRKIKDSSGQA